MHIAFSYTRLEIYLRVLSIHKGCCYGSRCWCNVLVIYWISNLMKESKIRGIQFSDSVGDTNASNAFHMRHIQKIILDNWFQLEWQEFINLIHRRIQIFFIVNIYMNAIFDEVMFIFQHFNTGNKLNEKNIIWIINIVWQDCYDRIIGI